MTTLAPDLRLFDPARGQGLDRRADPLAPSHELYKLGGATPVETPGLQPA
jgi:hypothetical protein